MRRLLLYLFGTGCLFCSCLCTSVVMLHFNLNDGFGKTTPAVALVADHLKLELREGVDERAEELRRQRFNGEISE